jgi:uncharacterized protein
MQAVLDIAEGDLPTDQPISASERRCLVTGSVRPKDELIRFVVGPDATIVPDVDERLGGRGLWLTSNREAIETAVAKRAFSRAARQQVRASDDLPRRVAGLVERRCLDLLGLARRAGQVVAGFEKVDAALRKGSAAVLIEARDGAADGRSKLRALAPAIPIVSCLDSAALAAALGRQSPVVHAIISPGRLAQRFLREANRLRGLI